jgi:hypothetical protein
MAMQSGGTGCVTLSTSVVACAPGQIFNSEFNTCFPAPVPVTAVVAPQPVQYLLPVSTVVAPQPVPVSTLTLPVMQPVPVSTFLFGGDDDDDDEDCCSDNGKSKGDSGSCGSKSKGDGKSKCCSEGKSKGDSSDCRTGKGKGSSESSDSEKDSIEMGSIVSAATSKLMASITLIASVAVTFFVFFS